MPTNWKIDAKERKLRAEAVQYGFASVRMEGLEPGPEAEALANRFIDGELTREEYFAAVRKLALDLVRNGH
jgi:Antitoxin VbhA